MEIRKAQRKQAKIKLALQEPSGSGKTLSSLLLASGLTSMSKIAVIDTENNSADLYSHLGDYNVLQLSKPFTPERYCTAIQTCEEAGMEVIIIDSVSHEWEGAGGILSLHGAMPGNSFANWAKVTPRHNAFVQKILQSNCHVISTIRTKTDYAMVERNGKYAVEKLGLKGITRDGMDYEFTLVFSINIKHLAVASKDRTGLFMDQPEEVITLNHGRKILDWCNSGISVDNVKAYIQSAKTVEKLREILRTYPEYEQQLKPLAIARKEQITTNIINLNPISGNGEQDDPVKVNSKPAVSPIVEFIPEQQTSDIHFMAANTKPMSLSEMSNTHTIPVFAKDNESTISNQEFIETIAFVTDQIFGGEQILKPAIRVSHPIKGRIPSAVGKPAKELLEHEKTLYYERLAFAVELPSINGRVANNGLNLTVGGVRAYNLENLHSKKSEERFKLFIGFQNKVCTNLCISTDGFKADVRVRTISELAKAAYNLFGEFNVYKQIEEMNNLPGTMISESQFAQIVGRARLFQNMPWKNRKELPQFPLSDSQVNLVVKDYYTDESFCRNDLGNINLWKLYNLFTGANKMNYIDSFLDRNVGCQQFVNALYKAIGENKHHWFVN